MSVKDSDIDLSPNQERIAQKWLDVFFALERDHGLTSALRLRALFPTDFRNHQDATRTLQEMKTVGYVWDEFESPSLWHRTLSGLEESRRLGITPT